MHTTAPLTVARTAAELRATVSAARAAGRSVGFVPTMGALHEGHATLVRAAARRNELVVVSVFVNPTQFDDPSDLQQYPRSEAADLELAAAAGAHVAFVPSVDEVYPHGFSTVVRPGAIAQPLEGEHRPGHFDGMATVVTRLLGLVAPDVAYFGRKDAQQLAIVRQVVRDLALPVEIAGVDTVREPDGLALSSRNRRLTPAERERALAISRGLRAATALAHGGEHSARALEAAVQAELDAAALTADYVALVDATTFLPVDALDRECVLAVAAFAGDVRLIDNVPLAPAAA